MRAKPNVFAQKTVQHRGLQQKTGGRAHGWRRALQTLACPRVCVVLLYVVRNADDATHNDNADDDDNGVGSSSA